MTHPESNRYFKLVETPIIIQNLLSISKEEKIEQFNHIGHNDHIVKSEHVVAHTNGDTKEEIDDTSTDFGYSGKMNLSERCDLLHQFNKTIGKGENDHMGNDKVSYRKNLNESEKKCKIYRQRYYD